MSGLILPGDPEFDLTLGLTLPPAEQPDAVFIVRPGSLLMEAVPPDQVDEYLFSGEYDERLLEMQSYDLADSCTDDFD